MKTKNQLKFLIMCSFLLSFFNLIAQDWANLKWYQDENAVLLSLLTSSSRVVFMGNSITQCWKENKPEFFSENPYICRGLSGQTTPQMLVRFRQDVIALQPKVVVILAGTNDIAGNTGPTTLEMIMDNLSSMAEIANANGIKVILCSFLTAYDYPWKKSMEPNIKIPLLNEMIKKYCKKTGFIYLDYFTSIANEQNGMKSEFTSDGVHCTFKGYEVMESLVKPVIEKALKKW